MSAADEVYARRKKAVMSRTSPTAGFLRVAPWVLAVFLCSTTGRAGVNTWTGGIPGDARGSTASLIAADPSDPYVVYAVFDPDLHRSVDGGRTWTRILSVGAIQSLLVHPTVTSTLFLGASDATGLDPRILKSTDGGVTWSRTELSGLGGANFVKAFAVTPTDPPGFLAGTSFGEIYKSVDGGDSWSPVSPGIGVAGEIASLVVDPKNEDTIYAGTESDSYYSYYYYPFGAFAKSVDGGAVWTELLSHDAVSAIAIDPETSTLFVGLYDGSARSAPILRSGDGGSSWTAAGSGLPQGPLVFDLVLDSRSPTTLYAATNTGVYRSHDAGASWNPFGPELPVYSLALGGNGRLLHAGTLLGVFDFEIGAGPIDVSPGPAGQSRVLFWEAERLSVLRVDASGAETSSPFEGPYPAWTATAIAEGNDGRSRVLWRHGAGRAALQIVGPAGGEEVFRFTRMPGWAASDVSVGDNGEARLLWTNVYGSMLLARVDSAGVATLGPQYGPYLGWAAVAISDGPDGSTWVLWRNTDGRASVSRHSASLMGSVFRWDSHPGWAAEDIAVGADGRPRLLWTNPDGRMEISTIDAAGQRVAAQTYASPGMLPRRIAAGADGRTRVLWSAPDGSGAVWLLHADNSLESQHPLEGAQ